VKGSSVAVTEQAVAGIRQELQQVCASVTQLLQRLDGVVTAIAAGAGGHGGSGSTTSVATAAVTASTVTLESLTLKEQPKQATVIPSEFDPLKALPKVSQMDVSSVDSVSASAALTHPPSRAAPVRPMAAATQPQPQSQQPHPGSQPQPQPQPHPGSQQQQQQQQQQHTGMATPPQADSYSLQQQWEPMQRQPQMTSQPPYYQQQHQHQQQAQVPPPPPPPLSPRATYLLPWHVSRKDTSFRACCNARFSVVTSRSCLFCIEHIRMCRMAGWS